MNIQPNENLKSLQDIDPNLRLEMDNQEQKISEKKLESLKKANSILGLDTIKQDKIIIVYCPPRVGSTSLVSSLRLSGCHIYKVLHIHDEEMLKIVGKIKDVSVIDIIIYNASLGRELFIFDIYRDPFERKMSEFFGKLASFHFNADISEIENYCMERLSKRFNNIFPFIGEEDHFLEKYTPISKDIPDKFDFSKKILHIQKQNVHFLKIRLRDYDNWHDILSPILKINITKIVDNKRDTLELKELYKMFKKNYRIPKNLFEHVINDSSFKFYLSEEESSNYIKKFEPKVCEEFVPFTEQEYKAYTFISSENQKNVDIESDHYFDEGCQCEYCQQARGLTIIRLEKGLPPKHKILHRFCFKKVSLMPKIEIKPYVEINETLTDTEVTTESNNIEITEEIQEEKQEEEKDKYEPEIKTDNEIDSFIKNSSSKIDIEKLLKMAKKMSDEQNEKEAKIAIKEYNNNKVKNNNEQISSENESDDSEILEDKNNKSELDLKLYTALHNIKLKKQKKEKDREEQKNQALDIRNKLQKEIDDNNKEFEKEEEEEEDVEEGEEENYKIKINKLRKKSLENFKKVQEDNIREERQRRFNRRRQIEGMSFKDKAAVIKNKLVDEIYGRSYSGPSLTSENLKKNQIINDIKLNHPKASHTPGIKATTSEYINQPPPIPRENQSSNQEPTHSQSLQQTPTRRIYKRSDGTFVYFKKEKNSNIVRMVPVEQPF